MCKFNFGLNVTWIFPNIHFVSYRKPLGDRLHDRDLEAAITLSLLNSAEEIKNQSSTSKGMLLLWKNSIKIWFLWRKSSQLSFLFNFSDIKLQVPVDENTDPASLFHSNCSVDSAVLGRYLLIFSLLDLLLHI